MFKQVLYAIRVLDLAPGWSAYTGRLLGDLGAEVIKIEPPAGDPLRGTPDFERLNANKYGCTLDISNADGLAKLQRLAEHADIVIASDTADLDALMAVKRSLIVVSLPTDAGVEQTVAAAAGVGVALWDRRRTGEGSRIDVADPPGNPRRLPTTGGAIREPVSTLGVELQAESSPWRLSESPTHIRLPAPALGEHNEYVLQLLTT
jgi:crotonobetainyl-CoA:carnitine CoA-transferase CaiB-like acyl-CoA transferase